jgi:penicillin-binding protein 1A
MPGRPYLRWTVICMVAFCGLGLLLAVAYFAHVMPDAPSEADLADARVAEPSTLLSADGKPLATYRRAKQKRIRLDEVSPYTVRALIATEDRRFFEHHGIDPQRTLMAVLRTLAGDVQGGSTITQQLARNLFPEEIGRERSIERKIKELVTAVRIERLYTKQQILEAYLNTVPFLYNVIGIEMAARTYFDKSAADLDPLESATLIGMLKGSYAFNPIVNPDRSRLRRNIVLANMASNDLLTDSELRALRDKPMQVHFNREPIPPGPAPHLAERVRKWLIEWADLHDYDIYTDGLVVQTTIDSALQESAVRAVERQADMLQTIADVEWAEKSVRVAGTTPDAYAKLHGKLAPFEHFWKTHQELLDAFVREAPEYAAARQAGESDAAALARLKADAAFMAQLRSAKTRLEASFVALDPASGEVRAWVGSRKFELDQFDHVAQSSRQPGSTFKPFVYGAALERGIAPEHAYVDEVVAIPLPDGKLWRPTDMSAASGERLTLREGLIRSKNTITVQVMRDVGVAGIVQLAQMMGVDRSTLDPVPSLALGTSPVTLLEMVSGYATIANSGEYRKPLAIKRILDRNGKVLAEFGINKAADSRRAMSERSAVELIDIMRGVVTQGTGQAIKTRFGITADVGGKTGTTQRNTDGWFILMHPKLVAGAWIGFNDTRVTMRSNYWGQGGHNAIYIVGDFFRDSLQKGRVDAGAQFPHPPPRPAVIALAEAENTEQPQARADGESGFAALLRSSGLAHSGRPARSAEEVGRIMEGMGREPETGRVTVPRPAGELSADPPDGASEAPQR